MIVKQIILVGCLALALISCDKASKKENRSSDYDQAVAADTPVAEGDATAAEGEIAQDSAEPKVDPAMALSGKDLYAKLCASCHQPLATTDVAKTSMSKLTIAIANEPTMAGLKDLSEKDLESIIVALSEISPGKGKGKAVAEEAAGAE